MCNMVGHLHVFVGWIKIQTNPVDESLNGHTVSNLVSVFTDVITIHTRHFKRETILFEARLCHLENSRGELHILTSFDG